MDEALKKVRDALANEAISDNPDREKLKTLRDTMEALGGGGE